jgi:arylsulfatase A-like enzyme
VPASRRSLPFVPKGQAVVAREFIPGWTLAAFIVLVLLAGCASEPEHPEKPNILLVTIDTLRADHLSSYGYSRATSPVVDRLAAEGVRFDQAVVQWPKTGPSFASMFSATYPKDNGIVRRVGRPVPSEMRLLAEELRDRGYQTHAVVSNGALASELRYNQGFETYDEVWKLGGDLERNNHAAAVNERALLAAERIRAANPEKTFFFWVHYIDPHFPYEPPEGWRDRFQGDAVFNAETRHVEVDPDRARADINFIGTDKVLDGRTDLAFYVARYDAEIAYVDEFLGRLLDALAERGLMDDTVTVLTSDHGESLGEHDYYFSHGRFGYQANLRVPFIVHAPERFEPHVDGAPAELVHLAPTLLDLAGGLPVGRPPEGRWMQGRSLMPRLRKEKGGRWDYGFAEAGYAMNRKWQRVVRDERFKMIHAVDWKDQRLITGQRRQPLALFDLVADPMETRNVMDVYPEDLARLQRALAAWWEAPAFDVLRDSPADADGDGTMSETTREQLKALGYLQ